MYLYALECAYGIHMHVCTHGGVPPNTGQERGSGPTLHPAVCTWPQPCSVGCHGPQRPALTHCCSGTPMLAASQAQTRVPHPPRPQLTWSPMGHAQGQGAWGSLVPCLVHGFALWAVVSRGAGGRAVGFGPPHFGTLHFPCRAGVGAAGLALSEPSLPPVSSSSPSSWSLRTRGVGYGGMDRGSVKW